MSDVNARVAVLEDWRGDHQKEHESIDERSSRNADDHIVFFKAIERLETKIGIFTAMGAVVGSVAGAVSSTLIIRFLTK